MLPPIARFLDPRPLGSHPIRDSVNIPLDELPNRMHELPARHGAVEIAGPEPWASRAANLLAAAGRQAVIASEWAYGERTPGRLWAPNAFLEEVSSRLTPGRALDLACGSGRDAVALAASGWTVTAVDHLPDALEMGADLERRYSPAEAPRIQWQCADLEAGALPAMGSAFDLITMFWYLNRSLIRSAAKLLAPGGSLIIETFTSVHRDTFGKPRTAAFVLEPGELRDLTQGLEPLQIEEDWHNGRHSARLWAVRPAQSRANWPS